jgi:hypothetical protein
MIHSAGYEGPGPGQAPANAKADGLTSPLLKLGPQSSSVSDLGALDYLNRLPSCGATVAFYLCPGAFKLLCGLAGALDRSGTSIGKVGEAAGLRAPATRSAALRMLTALGLVSVDRARGAGGEVRGTQWQLLAPPTSVRREARALVKALIAQRIERSRRIEGELPEEPTE